MIYLPSAAYLDCRDSHHNALGPSVHFTIGIAELDAKKLLQANTAVIGLPFSHSAIEWNVIHNRPTKYTIYITCTTCGLGLY
jgi:hypothetical protein